MLSRLFRRPETPSHHYYNTSTVYRTTSVMGVYIKTPIASGTRSECERLAARVQQTDPHGVYGVMSR